MQKKNFYYSMDGFYPNNKHRKYLNKWYKGVIEMVLLDRLPHLHIDYIDKKMFSDRNLWFDGALYFYNILYNDVIDKSLYDCLLVIPLKYGRKKTDMKNVNNITVAHIKRKIDDMESPSIYIFKKNSENYDLTLSKSYYLEKLSKQLNMNAYFSEAEDYPNEFDRYIFIVPFKNDN